MGFGSCRPCICASVRNVCQSISPSSRTGGAAAVLYCYTLHSLILQMNDLNIPYFLQTFKWINEDILKDVFLSVFLLKE